LRNTITASLGEIDIIAEQDGVVVFIEVKAREDHQYGHPFNATNPANHRLLEKPTRFYVIGLKADPKGAFRIALLENAFQMG
jgi:putative endonuclease